MRPAQKKGNKAKLLLTPGPTVFALTLKFLKLSSPMSNFASGHLTLPPGNQPSGGGRPNALFRAAIVRASNNGPSSLSINACTFSAAACSEVCVLATM
jgi:hypothetical protein